MKTLKFTVCLAALLMAAGLAEAQITSNMNLQVVVGVEASMTVPASTLLQTSGTTFANPFTGSTVVNYKVRTGRSAGSGAITVTVATDFSPSGGPSVAASGTTGDTLSYNTTLSSNAAGSGVNTVAQMSATNVVSFGANDRSQKAGDTATMAWTLVNDPQYAADSYQAVVTYTLSIT